MTRGDLMAAAWAGFVRFAVLQPELVSAFEAETGKRLPPASRSGLDLAIDRACASLTEGRRT